MAWIHQLLEWFHQLLAWLAGWVIEVITATGGWGVFTLMALESANIPIPSEVIMPFAGFVASQGGLNIWWLAVLGGLGNTAGSWASYEIGRRGGRPFVERYGRFFLVHSADLETGDRYFRRHGLKIAFWSRLLPVVRTFISLPAGINGAPLGGFLLFTFIGSLLWSLLLASIGFWMGENWVAIRPIFEKFSYAIALLILLGVAVYVWHHLRKGHPREAEAQPSEAQP